MNNDIKLAVNPQVLTPGLQQTPQEPQNQTWPRPGTGLGRMGCMEARHMGPTNGPQLCHAPSGPNLRISEVHMDSSKEATFLSFLMQKFREAKLIWTNLLRFVVVFKVSQWLHLDESAQKSPKIKRLFANPTSV